MDWTDYLESIRRNGDLLAAAAQRDLDPAVPSCPGWKVRDLVEHTAVVHRHKAEILSGRLQENPAPPQAPDTGLMDWYRAGLDTLVAALAATPPETALYSWFAANQTAGFWYRRMAHETLIHRIDAELAFGRLSPVDPALAADGVDEVLRDYVGGIPAWGVFAPEEATIDIACSDRPESWTIRLGRFTGASPATGTAYDLDSFIVVDEVVSPDTTIRGTATGLDLWLWGRGPDSDLAGEGDPSLRARLRAICAADMG